MSGETFLLNAIIGVLMGFVATTTVLVMVWLVVVEIKQGFEDGRRDREMGIIYHPEDETDEADS